MRDLVFVAFIDHDAAEVGDGFDEFLEPFVPFGRGFEEEHHALMREPKLQVAELADVVDEVLGVVDLWRVGVRVSLVTKLLEQDGDVGFLQRYFAHGDEGGAGGAASKTLGTFAA